MQQQQAQPLTLSEHAWFARVDRTLAHLILIRINQPLGQTLFMVRCSDDTGYAISIKQSGVVHRIKINVRSGDGASASPITATTTYSIDEQRAFDSIQSLVAYYSHNALTENFPQLDGTLGTAFRDALPPSVGRALAVHDFTPTAAQMSTSELIELRKNAIYHVVNKQLNDWWRVYNHDGLLGYAPKSYLYELPPVET